MNDQVKQLMYNSLEKKYQSQIDEMKATLMIYFENPVGIGEHPQHLEEMDKLLEKLSAAEDKLQNLKKFLNYKSCVPDTERYNLTKSVAISFADIKSSYLNNKNDSEIFLNELKNIEDKLKLFQTELWDRNNY